MTRRDVRLIEALIGESRVWVNTLGPGTVWVAATRSQSKAVVTPEQSGRTKPVSGARANPGGDQNRRSSKRY